MIERNDFMKSIISNNCDYFVIFLFFIIFNYLNHSFINYNF